MIGVVPFTHQDGHSGPVRLGGRNVQHANSTTRTVKIVTFLIATVWLDGACSGTSSVYFNPAAADAGLGVVASGGGSSSGSGSSGSTSSSGGSSSGSGSSSSGSSSSSGGSSSSGSGSSSGSSSSGGSPGVPTTGVCAYTGTRVLTNSQADAFIDDFEEATISPGWSSFNDVSPVPNFFEIMQVAGGAVGTLHAGRYAGAGATTIAMGGFGVGVVYNTAINVAMGVYCIDISAFTGVSFWAKAAAEGSTISLNFVVPQANIYATNDAGAPTEGDCQTNCYDYPRVSFSLTTSWAQYTAPFSAAAGGSVALGNVIQQLEWLSPDSNWDFTLDEIAFYTGTPPVGPVGPNPSAN
jgi:hypothetical protein